MYLGEADHGAGDGEPDVIEDMGAGDTDGLAGLVLGDSAEVAERGADDGGGLAGQRAGTERAGRGVRNTIYRSIFLEYY